MIIDLIFDRQCGEHYNPHRFYFDCLQYGETGTEITRAMDQDNEFETKKALVNYVIDYGYNPEVIRYILSVDWLSNKINTRFDKWKEKIERATTESALNRIIEACSYDEMIDENEYESLYLIGINALRNLKTKGAKK